MSFNKKTWIADEDLTEKEMNDLEDRTEKAFKEVTADTGWKTQGAYMTYRVFGGIVTLIINGAGITEIAPNSSIVIGVIPVEARPSTQITFAGIAGYNKTVCQFGINPNGEVSAYVYGTNKESYFRGSFTYIK